MNLGSKQSQSTLASTNVSNAKTASPSWQLPPLIVLDTIQGTNPTVGGSRKARALASVSPFSGFPWMFLCLCPVMEQRGEVDPVDQNRADMKRY